MPKELSLLTTLLLLRMDHNAFSELPRALEDTPSVRIIDASFNKITSLDFTNYENSSLSVVTLDSNSGLTEIKGVSTLKKLEYLFDERCCVLSGTQF